MLKINFSKFIIRRKFWIHVLLFLAVSWSPLSDVDRGSVMEILSLTHGKSQLLSLPVCSNIVYYVHVYST